MATAGLSRRAAALLLSIAVVIAMIPQPAEAFSKGQHDSDLEAVLFKDGGPADASEKDKLKAIEAAVAICLDYTGNGGEDDYSYLTDEFGVSGLPKHLEDMVIRQDGSGRNHRASTHQGWDFQASVLESDSDKEAWEKRRDMLRSTVYEVFEYDPLPKWLSWLPFGQKPDERLEAQLESFCALVYYTHVLGDYAQDIELGDYRKFNGDTNGRKIPFAVAGAGKNGSIDIFSELESHLEILFEGQKGGFVYEDLMQELKTLASESRDLCGSDGRISEEQLDAAGECVDELKDLLGGDARRVGTLLEDALWKGSR